MATKPFLTKSMMTRTIPKLRARGLETRLGIDGRRIMFDRKGEPLLSVDVVIEWANRLPSGVAGGSTRVVGTEGDLLGRVGELDVRAGDMFMIGSSPAEITVAAKEVKGIMVAGFRMATGKGGQ